MTVLVSPARLRSGADTAIGRFLGDEKRGLAIDFLTMEAVVRDDDAPVGSFYGLPSALLTYTSPPTKFVCNAAGVLVSGNTMRTDYDPVTLLPKGLLIEEVRTNVASNSQNIIAYGPAAVTGLADVAVAPDGTTTADKMVETAANSNHLYYGSFNATAAAWTVSVYAKAAERTWLYLRLDLSGPIVGAFFNLATGTVGTVEAGVTATIHPAGNGWYRCSVTRTLTAVVYYMAVALTTGDGIKSHIGDGTSGVFIWGLQLELGPIPTSYIPTIGSSVQRVKDNITLTGAQLPLVSGVGTVLVEFLITYVNQPNCSILDIGRGASGEQNRVHGYFDSNSYVIGFIKDAAGAGQFSYTFNPVPIGVAHRLALAWAANDFAACLTGMAVQTDTSGVAPTTYDKLHVHGNYFDTGGSRHIRKIKYLPRRVSNAELAAMVA